MSKRRLVWALLVGTILLAASWGIFALWQELAGTRAQFDDQAAVLRRRTTDLQEARQSLEERRRSLRKANRHIRQLEHAIAERQPCPSYPRLFLIPPAGPVGTRVSFHGYCFVGSLWGRDGSGQPPGGRGDHSGLFIMNPAQDVSEGNSNGGPTCELIGQANPSALFVRKDGTARGFLTIPASGACFQESRRDAVTPGTYSIGLDCHSCAPLAVFRVTP
jgi:hypothetical protein